MTAIVRTLVSDLIRPDGRESRIALRHDGADVSYGALHATCQAFARSLLALKLTRGERVAVYLDKRIETVVGMFGAAAAGLVFVPVNPLLKGEQVGHILRDCNVRVLVTSDDRLALLKPTLEACEDLRHVVVVGGEAESIAGLDVIAWSDSVAPSSAPLLPHRNVDVAAILYTSGSTGRPKGVVLSHRNMVAGAKSVASYLEQPCRRRPCWRHCRSVLTPASASSPPPFTSARAWCC
jgi:acyl-CoA synthetase (AMP-forming)/AMP-acid ligase II